MLITVRAQRVKNCNSCHVISTIGYFAHFQWLSLSLAWLVQWIEHNCVRSLQRSGSIPKQAWFFFRFFFNCLQVKVVDFYCKDHVHFHNIYWLNMFLIKKPLKHLSLLRCYTDSKFSGERDISKHRGKYLSCHRRCTYDFIVLEAEFKFPKSHVCWCASVICLA